MAIRSWTRATTHTHARVAPRVEAHVAARALAEVAAQLAAVDALVQRARACGPGSRRRRARCPGCERPAARPCARRCPADGRAAAPALRSAPRTQRMPGILMPLVTFSSSASTISCAFLRAALQPATTKSCAISRLSALEQLGADGDLDDLQPAACRDLDLVVADADLDGLVFELFLALLDLALHAARLPHQLAHSTAKLHVSLLSITRPISVPGSRTRARARARTRARSVIRDTATECPTGEEMSSGTGTERPGPRVRVRARTRVRGGWGGLIRDQSTWTSCLVASSGNTLSASRTRGCPSALRFTASLRSSS